MVRPDSEPPEDLVETQAIPTNDMPIPDAKRTFSYDEQKALLEEALTGYGNNSVWRYVRSVLDRGVYIGSFRKFGGDGYEFVSDAEPTPRSSCRWWREKLADGSLTLVSPPTSVERQEDGPSIPAPTTTQTEDVFSSKEEMRREQFENHLGWGIEAMSWDDDTQSFDHPAVQANWLMWNAGWNAALDSQLKGEGN